MVEKSHTSGFWPSLYDPFRQMGERVREWLAPASEASGSDNAYTITVELPGVEEKDIDLSVDDSVVTLKGEKRTEREEKGETWFFSERQYGAFSRSFRLMVESESLKVLDILASASAVIAEGEVAQLTTANDTATTEENYLYVIRSKTAALFAAACQIGGHIAQRDGADEDALEQYGANLGIAFQLVDDYLDYSATDEAFGKGVGDDFREGKITLPIVLAMRRGDSDEHAFWHRTLEEMDQRDGDLERAMEILASHDALSDTLIRARGYADTARAALAGLPDNAHRKALEDVVDFCVERAY